MDVAEVDYKPRTEFLKNEIAKANFNNPKDRKRIMELCKVEDLAYRYQVKREPKRFYGSYSFLYGEQFGSYREEYFKMLKELSYRDYIYVLTMEVSDPETFGGWRNGKQIPLPKGISKEDKAEVLEMADHMSKRMAEREAEEQRIQKQEEKEKAFKFKKWWVKNSK
ncbi:MAG: hypothetical protein M1564_03050 [Candidatus Marsarchaeota archaeon]|nr:hypothetical protein [Candidatus Marsarchaeota archaeon]